jgi:hypothetical protein
MNRKLLFTAAAGLAAIVAVGSLAIADPAEDQLDFKLPPGWTMEDMKACMMAGTPGEVHKEMAKEVGVWNGKTTMWMSPEGEAMESECTSTVSTLMDGRYLKVEMEGEMPGMGPYNGLGLYGFDNVSQELTSIWIDNHSTGIMIGKGESTDDGKQLTWNYTANCPITKKPTTMREVETWTGPDTKTLEMFGADPKSGKEYKIMSIKLTRQK